MDDDEAILLCGIDGTGFDGERRKIINPRKSTRANIKVMGLERRRGRAII